MNPNNREVQARKTCELYAYVLISQDKEVPDVILECASSYDYPVECVSELAQELKSLDTATFERIINNPFSQEARDLARWWEMYQTYIPVS
ncbi:hypothetical protein FJR45_06215 [Sulfurimonas sediminis]|uniref:Uncharacterized protein n=1 Tax=Sulfurimonas sediminis TaxID=2590020 RepID=A0A7M1B4D7_9BACT|nr:hypothetical protein [Sulfurimonas sediminis]QOP43568.1 hypothetical protein FJR45_06215 [Sulfurimonas sediminis]